eukprot:5276449-Prymnesium_polylepis.1
MRACIKSPRSRSRSPASRAGTSMSGAICRCTAPPVVRAGVDSGAGTAHRASRESDSRHLFDLVVVEPVRARAAAHFTAAAAGVWRAWRSLSQRQLGPGLSLDPKPK